jgi:hypothetical protein
LKQTGGTVYTKPTTGNTQLGSQSSLRICHSTILLERPTNLRKFWKIPTTRWLPQQTFQNWRQGPATTMHRQMQRPPPIRP